MKKLLFIVIPISIMTLSGCDKIGIDAYKPVIELDTTLFSEGNWVDYPWPEFDDASGNTVRNILLEDYTGHKCQGCPGAATKAAEIEDANPGRVFVVSIHQGGSNDNSFQNIAADCGEPTNPNDKFCHNFITDEGIEIGSVFATGFGFNSNPSGTINRINFDDGANMFTGPVLWESRVNTLLNTPDPVAELQVKSNFYPETDGAYLHVQTEFLDDF